MSLLRDVENQARLSVKFQIEVGATVHLISSLTVSVYLRAGVVTSAPGARWTFSEYLFTRRPGVGWLPGFAYISGDALFALLLVMLLTSLPVVRASGHFQVRDPNNTKSFWAGREVNDT